MPQPSLVPHDDRHDPGASPEEVARAFHECLRKRRSVREYSGRPVSRETVEWLVRCAAWAPSGANKQPWRFVAVADSGLKRRIRLAAEEEERQFYRRRASERWLEDLAALGTGEGKDFLEAASWLIVVFKLVRGDEGEQVYYPDESVGIAVGMLLAAAQHAGLATLCYTPSPMGFLTKLLGRPEHERPWLVIPVGYPADDCHIPLTSLQRKPLEDVLVLYE